MAAYQQEVSPVGIREQPIWKVVVEKMTENEIIRAFCFKQCLSLRDFLYFLHFRFIPRAIRCDTWSNSFSIINLSEDPID